MAGIENRAFDEQIGPQSGDTPAVLDVPKDGYYKITKSGKVKLPRQLLHCSDGVYEEYSTDEEEEEENQPVIDPKTLTWGPYLWYYTAVTAGKGLAVCDYLGEKLAWFFGITSPRYQYALDEFERMQQEQKELEDLEREEREAELEIVATAKAEKSMNRGPGDYGTTTLNVDDVTVTEKKE